VNHEKSLPEKEITRVQQSSRRTEFSFVGYAVERKLLRLRTDYRTELTRHDVVDSHHNHLGHFTIHCSELYEKEAVFLLYSAGLAATREREMP
jgi:hypothetical protein